MRLTWLLLMLTLTTSNLAAQHYSLTSVGALDDRCIQAKQIAAPILDTMPATGDTIIIVCSDKEFDAFAKRMGGYPQSNALALMQKDGTCWMYFRAGALLGDVRKNTGFTPRHIIAHEFGHKVWKTTDENMAERWASQHP